VGQGDAGVFVVGVVEIKAKKKPGVMCAGFFHL
jgi:hypothetical protein